jgi:type III pantothenate kinase
MRFILDFGNTNQKIAVFDNDRIVLLEQEESIRIRFLETLAQEFPEIDCGIISSVVPLRPALKKFLKKTFDPFIILSHQTPIPLTNRYKTPRSLGKDRLACAVAASRMFEGVPAMVINAGTCITYDFVNAEGEYLGGAISPGLQMRAQSLHNFTHQLPLIEIETPQDLIGTRTASSILSGVVNGTVQEITGVVKQYQKRYPNLQVILSGGDAKFLDKLLKIRIFAFPNIVMVGLNYILEYNLKDAK